RVGGVALDLAAQAIDLNVDGALADRAARPGERLARHRLARRRRQQPKHLALAIGEPDRVLAALELAAPEVKLEITEAHRFNGGSGCWPAAAQDTGYAQRELPRLEWLCEIIVCTDGQSLDTALGLRTCREHDDRNVRAC